MSSIHLLVTIYIPRMMYTYIVHSIIYIKFLRSLCSLGVVFAWDQDWIIVCILFWLQIHSHPVQGFHGGSKEWFYRIPTQTSCAITGWWEPPPQRCCNPCARNILLAGKQSCIAHVKLITRNAQPAALLIIREIPQKCLQHFSIKFDHNPPPHKRKRKKNKKKKEPVFLTRTLGEKNRNPCFLPCTLKGWVTWKFPHDAFIGNLPNWAQGLINEIFLVWQCLGNRFYHAKEVGIHDTTWGSPVILLMHQVRERFLYPIMYLGFIHSKWLFGISVWTINRYQEVKGLEIW